MSQLIVQSLHLNANKTQNDIFPTQITRINYIQILSVEKTMHLSNNVICK